MITIVDWDTTGKSGGIVIFINFTTEHAGNAGAGVDLKTLAPSPILRGDKNTRIFGSVLNFMASE